MPFCTECGAKIEPDHKFCNNCGTPVYQSTNRPTKTPLPPAYSPPQTYTAPVPQQINDPILLTITVLRKMKSFGRSDTFFLTASGQRIIISPLTKERINQAIERAKQNAKAEGKGFWGQWKAQLGTSYNYADQYISVASERVINENPGSIVLPNSSITQIQLKSRNDYRNDTNISIYTLYIRTHQGTFEYRLDSTSGMKELLKLYKGRTKSNVHFW